MSSMLYTIIRSSLVAVTSVVIVVSVQSCGFHLREATVIPAEAKSVGIKDLPIGSEIAPAINLQLTYIGIDALDQVQGANLIFVVNDEKYNRRVLTVNAVGQVKEYELVYVVKYSIKNVHHAGASINNQTITIKRDMRFEPNEVLGSADEESRLRKEMVSAAAQQIVRRLPKAVSAPRT